MVEINIIHHRLLSAIQRDINLFSYYMFANTNNIDVVSDKLLRKIMASEQEKIISTMKPSYQGYNSQQYPCAMPPHSSGVLIGVHPNPPSFYPHASDSLSTNCRRQYVATQKPTTNANTILQTKYVAPQACSLRTNHYASNSVGQSSYKQGLPDSSPLSFKGSFQTLTDERRAKRFVRSSGCVAPAKKNGINNKAYYYTIPNNISF